MAVFSEARTSGLTYNLNHYYTNKIQINREQTKLSVERTLPKIQAILQRINQLDPRFKAELVAVGSYWTNLKVDKPDEFDVNVPMSMPRLPFGGGGSLKQRYYEVDPNDRTKVRKSQRPLPPPPVGYMWCNVGRENRTSKEPSRSSSDGPHLNQSELNDLSRFDTPDMSFEGDLIPLLVRTRFKNLLKEAVRQLDYQEEVKVSRREHGPALTIYIHQPRQININVDFTPMFRMGNWPGNTNWPRTEAKWPSKEKIYRIKQKGVNSVAKKDMDWFRSYAEAEKELISDMDSDGGCRKKVHRVMKKLALDVWCPEERPVLSSYILKNLFFWECERYPSSRDWGQDQIWTRFETLTLRLRDALCTKQHLPLYFEPAVNLLEGKDPVKMDQVVRNLDRFLQNPVPYLQ